MFPLALAGFFLLGLAPICAFGQATDSGQTPAETSQPDPQNWNLHFQSTAIGQGYPSFSAQYTGANSLTPAAQIKETVSVDVTGGVRVWRGGEFFGDVVIWQGFGLSDTLGTAGFPNGEAYRLGKRLPDAYLCRAYLRQTFGFGREKEASDDAPDDLRGSKDVRRLTFTIGHLSSKDIFDNNAYANDSRSQFMNWSLVANTAWDYPADVLGFTNGAIAELNSRAWTERVGIFQMSQFANGERMEWDFGKSWGLVGEIERRYSLRGHAGTLRPLAYDQRAHMGSYQDTIDNPSLEEDIYLTAAYRYKYGFGINMDQEITKDLGAFMRLGWSDGKNQTYEFTDVDRTATLGLDLKGTRWRRPNDDVGLAQVVNGISAVHKEYLAAGGLGILVGDGALDYRTERITESYYNWKMAKHYHLTFDYQFVQNPGYNHVRGPIDIFALRLHMEY